MLVVVVVVVVVDVVVDLVVPWVDVELGVEPEVLPDSGYRGRSVKTCFGECTASFSTARLTNLGQRTWWRAAASPR